GGRWAVADPRHGKLARHPLERGTGLVVADSGWVDPKRPPAVHAAIALGHDFTELCVAHGLGHRLPMLHVPAPAVGIGAPADLRIDFRLHGRQDQRQTHGGTPSRCKTDQTAILPQLSRPVNDHAADGISTEFAYPCDTCTPLDCGGLSFDSFVNSRSPVRVRGSAPARANRAAMPKWRNWQTRYA